MQSPWIPNFGNPSFIRMSLEVVAANLDEARARLDSKADGILGSDLNYDFKEILIVDTKEQGQYRFTAQIVVQEDIREGSEMSNLPLVNLPLTNPLGNLRKAINEKSEEEPYVPEVLQNAGLGELFKNFKKGQTDG